jgi:hypothetical protein
LVVGRADILLRRLVRHGGCVIGLFCEDTRREQVWIDGAIRERIDYDCVGGSSANRGN